MSRAPIACFLAALVALLPPARGDDAESGTAGASDDPTVEAEPAQSAAQDDAADPYRQSLWQRAFARPDFDPGYRLSFRLEHDIPLPGPLPDGQPRLIDGRIAINVAGGVARTGWNEDAVAQLDPGATQQTPPLWAVDPAGSYRARFLESGHLVVEKRCKRCRAGWRGQWKMQVPGTVLTRPLLTANRIYFGAQDNRVYSVKKGNGHRIWVADLGDRVSEPVVLWDGTVEIESENGVQREREVQVILVVPDGGSVLVALDARGGREMARYPLRVEDGRLLGVPLQTPDGKIVVAREKYTPGEASLLVLAFSSGSKRPQPGAAPPTTPADDAAPAATVSGRSPS